MRSDPIVALIVGVVLIVLVVLSRRLCRRGKRTPAATKPPRATREPKPFAGLTRKPDCPACEQEAGLQPAAAGNVRLKRASRMEGSDEKSMADRLNGVR